jgi:hypothetical protein
MRQKVKVLTLSITMGLAICLTLGGRGSTATEVGVGTIPSSPALSTVIEEGVDHYSTPCSESSYWDFSVIGPSQGFFGEGSDALSGRVRLKGLPLSIANPEHYNTDYGATDTIWRRTASAQVPAPGQTASIPIELVALSLVGCAPITVYYGGLPRQQWDLSVSVGSSAGQMSISDTCGLEIGGNFDLNTTGFPVLVFTLRPDGSEQKTMDLGEFQVPWFLRSSSSQWSSSAPESFGLFTVPSDGSRNFFPGVWRIPCLESDCAVKSNALEVMIKQEWSSFLVRGATVFSQGMLPAERTPSPDSDGDSLPNHADNCPTTANPLQQDTDHDGRGDVCDGNPTIYDPCKVIIDGCDSTVPNHAFDDGTTFSDKITACAAGARNHGAFVTCVDTLLVEWERLGLIRDRQPNKIHVCAANARIP